MPYMTVVDQNLISRSMEYVPKQTLTSGSDSMCLGEIRMFQSAYLLVSNVLSVISVNMDQSGYQIWFSSANVLL